MVEKSPVENSSKREISRNVALCVETLLNLLSFFGYEPKRDYAEAYNKTKTHWVEGANLSGGWEKFVKYKLAAYFAFHTEQEQLPNKPFPETLDDHPGHLIGGRAGRFINRKLLRAPFRERMEFLSSISNLKKGLPRPSKEQLRKAERETIQKLTRKAKTPSPVSLVSWAEMEDVKISPSKIPTTLSKETFKSQLRRTVQELFAGHRYSDEDRFRSFFPSTSANYMRSRDESGAVGAILDAPELLRGLRKVNGVLNTTESSSSDGEEKIEQPRERGRLQDSLMITTGQDALAARFRTLYERIFERARHELPLVEPVGLAEPLKVRVITKGPPMLYFAVRPMWKFTHSILRRHRVFCLIGEPATADLIWKELGASLKDDEVFVSGDYKDSTNSLASWCSNTVADEIGKVCGFTEAEQTLFLESLTGHVFLPDDEDVKDQPDLVEELKALRADPQRVPSVKMEGRLRFQQHGQLMGGITSFPILCLVNMTICRWAMELAKGWTLPLATIPLLINGDDCAFKTTKMGFQHWERIATFSGMESSVGKTFVSRKFVNINSTNFVYDTDHPEPVMTRRTIAHPKTRQPVEEVIFRYNPYKMTNYVNMGLIRGLKRSAASDILTTHGRDMSTIGTHYREAMKMAPERMRWMVDLEFVKQNFQTLRRYKLPWRIPEWLGGLGLTGPGSPDPSRLDRQIAARILRNWREVRPVPTNSRKTSWRIWQVAAQRLPPSHATLDKAFPGVQEWTGLVGSYCVNILFDESIGIDELRKLAQSEEGNLEALRHNERLWRPGFWLPQPLEVGALSFQPRYESARSDPSFVASPHRRLAQTPLLD